MFSYKLPVVGDRYRTEVRAQFERKFPGVDSYYLFKKIHNTSNQKVYKAIINFV